MNKDLCIVLTARMGSTRLPGKAMADVNGRPLIYWILRRLQGVGNVVLGITHEPDDDALVGIADAMGIPVTRWAKGDVVGTIDAAYKQHYKDSRFLLRALGDMPWLATDLVDRACRVMRKYDAEAFAWALQPDSLPLYGAREFPYSISGWQKVVEHSTVREHSDIYFCEHRDQFKVVYHTPPKQIYQRPFYRVEVDYPQDLELVRAVAGRISMLAPLDKIINVLDTNSDIAKLNLSCTEKTGPSHLSYAVKRAWYHDLEGKPIVDWDDTVWTTPNNKSQPIFCKSGQCFLGLAEDGILFSKAGRIRGNAYLACGCGAGLVWK